MLSRKEKETKILDALNLKVGDKIMLLEVDAIYEIVDVGQCYELRNIDNRGITLGVTILIGHTFNTFITAVTN